MRNCYTYFKLEFMNGDETIYTFYQPESESNIDLLMLRLVKCYKNLIGVRLIGQNVIGEKEDNED